MSAWKRLRQRLEVLGCQWLASFVPQLSRQSCQTFGNAIGGLAYYFDRHGRSVAHENLRAAFGRRYTPAQRWRIALASYQNFARTMLSLFWAKRFEHEDYRPYLQPVGFDTVGQRARKEGRGVVFLGQHYGNWEWASLSAGFGGFTPLAIAMPFRNAELEQIFSRPRKVSGAQIIARDGALLKVMREVKRGGSVALLLDLTVRPSQAATVIDCFGGLKMCVSGLPGILAERANALLSLSESEPHPDGTCTNTVRPVEIPAGATENEIAQLCWNLFEPMIIRSPELWIWPYKHFRFKPTDTEREYPLYSNRSGAFDRLLREIEKASARRHLTNAPDCASHSTQ